MVKALSFPFDSAYILRKQNRMKKTLLDSGQSFLEKRIAVLGGSTTEEAVKTIELFLLAEGIKPTFYQSEYNHFWEDAVFGNEDLDSFSPDLVIVHTSVRNLRISDLESVNENIQKDMLEEDIRKFRNAWESLANRFECPIILNNFERPVCRIFGNQDVCDPRGASYYAQRMNQELYEFCRSHESFYVHDIEGLSSRLGLWNWHDEDSWALYKNAFAISLIPDYSYSITRVVKSIFGKNKKALALDLDNTLWGGVIGDDGVEGVSMGPETAVGEKHRALQRYLLLLNSMGIILTVNSKNEYENALEGLRHDDCLLREDKFASIKANWLPKGVNMKELAADLNLGIDSFVFVDDNKAERENVSQYVPEVTCLQFEDVGSVSRLIDAAGYFEPISLTEDDKNRSEMYRQNAQRKSFERSFGSYDEYLSSLLMVSEQVGFDARYIPRIAQLTNKTNQFNLTTRRYTEDDISSFAQDPDRICLAFKLSDKFGDNGLVSVVMGVEQNDEIIVDLWLMSCRVLGRGLERFALNALADAAAERGMRGIRGFYFPTKKNKLVQNMYGDLGFSLVSEEDGSSEWFLDLNGFRPLDTKIEKGRE